jgi:hypothetical protein
MYVRQAKQFLRNAIEGFDERKYGFASVVDLLRAAGKEGVLRVERDRQGAVRVFPGANLAPRVVTPVEEPPLDVEEPNVDEDEPADVEGTAVAVEVESTVMAEPVGEPPIVDVEPVISDEPEVVTEEPAKQGRRRKAPAPRAKAARSAKPVKPRSNKTRRAKSQAADKQ